MEVRVSRTGENSARKKECPPIGCPVRGGIVSFIIIKNVRYYCRFFELFQYANVFENAVLIYYILNETSCWLRLFFFSFLRGRIFDYAQKEERSGPSVRSTRKVYFILFETFPGVLSNSLDTVIKRGAENYQNNGPTAQYRVAF